MGGVHDAELQRRDQPEGWFGVATEDLGHALCRARGAVRRPEREENVSACLIARMNSQGVTVPILLHGPQTAELREGASVDCAGTVTSDPFAGTEREGAFWGNLFLSTPVANLCTDIGAVNNGGTRACGQTCDDDPIIDRGACSALCTAVSAGARGGYYTPCAGTKNVMTVWMAALTQTTKGLVTCNGLRPASLALRAASLPTHFARSLASAQALTGSESGREVLRYLGQCALPAGTTLTVGSQSLAGGFGLAPEWASQGLSAGQAERMTACVLAHVNQTGAKVPIQLATPGRSDLDFTARDGVFFGDFASGELYACELSAASDSAHSAARVCDQPGNACGITSLGACASVCDDAGCIAPTGRRFSHPVEVRLQAL